MEKQFERHCEPNGPKRGRDTNPLLSVHSGGDTQAKQKCWLAALIHLRAPVSVGTNGLDLFELKKQPDYAGCCTSSEQRISRSLFASVGSVNGFCSNTASVSRIP
jgi:hypothetical protein